MDYPGFISSRNAIGLGAKLDAEKVFFDSILVKKKSLRHQAQELLELELVFVLRLLQLQQGPGIFHQLANARIVLLPLVGVKCGAVDSKQTEQWAFLGVYLHFGKRLLPRAFLDHTDPLSQLLTVRQLICDDRTHKFSRSQRASLSWIVAGNRNCLCGLRAGDTVCTRGFVSVRVAEGKRVGRYTKQEAASGQHKQENRYFGLFHSNIN